MGAVYRGRSRSGREVAAKVVHAQYAEDAVFRTRFRQGIAAARRVEAESGDVFTEILLLDPATGARERVEPAGGGLRGAGTLREGTLWFTTPDGAVTAVSPRTGSVRWRTRTTLEQPGPAAPDPRTHTLYLARPAGRVAALDTREGTLLWETHPRSEGAALAGVTGSAVLPHEGTLVVTTPDGTVFGMDPGHPDREPVPG
ncbi:PQQ-binding-like beta-propeller repeat protein [Streptomyces leeuwenhoekii]|uniref:Serine/Threonine Protein Kinase n=1 Tax=Streptomyces leeuwenhoekii TaxID=1437453 RepID=A0A0F7VV59_STRLW|nr:PQQ-binding-like beta-propeller repeat protein [Streptomyces leeuwenhoekii]CQR64434.1 Serine/Threonine Protein Kinase [Streptomyces leeuwenhoekii]